eukprot:4423789-Prymnesium_polylepis.2
MPPSVGALRPPHRCGAAARAALGARHKRLSRFATVSGRFDPFLRLEAYRSTTAARTGSGHRSPKREELRFGDLACAYALHGAVPQEPASRLVQPLPESLGATCGAALAWARKRAGCSRSRAPRRPVPLRRGKGMRPPVLRLPEPEHT